MRRIKYTLLILFSFPFPSVYTEVAHAQEGLKRNTQKHRARFELEEVVVTGTPIEEEEVRKVPRNVTVITGDDIAQAPSNNVVDLLAREANINLQSLFGHDKNAAVDIRGQGINAASNVIVMVDGFRLNSPDLAGPDLSSVPLDQIERIEIVRGAGSVVYGNGAVGGVVNIITKKGQQGREIKLRGSYGSFDTYDGRAAARGRFKNLDYSLQGSYYGTEGYRDNGSYRRKDLSARLGYGLFESTELSFSISFHDDDQGFPGAVPLEFIDSRSLRKSTATPKDSGSTRDWRFQAGLDHDLDNWGALTCKAGGRIRRNDFVLGFTPLKPPSEQEGRIDENTLTFNVKYDLDYEALGRGHSLQLGADYYYTDYISERPDERIRKNSRVNDFGVFFQNRWSILEDLMLNFGFRLDRYEGEFRNDELLNFTGQDRWVNGQKFDRNWDNHAADMGIVYSPRETTTLFASYATSFRIPNVDELALAVDDLQPQKGNHIDLGIRQRMGRIAEGSITLFQMEIDDEIFFDPVSRVNKNFEDKTLRRGVELELKFYPLDSLYIWGNYTYMDAKFESEDAFIPLVPGNKASLGVEWHILGPLLLSLTGTWVDSKFDGNDFTNDRFRKIDPYTVVDGRLTYTGNNLKIFGGVNNLFDELYETLAFSEAYFPMPTRNFYLGVEWKF